MFASMHWESQYLHYHGIRNNNLPNTVLLEDSWQLSFLHFLKGKVSRVLLKAWGSTIRWEHCIFRIIQVEEWFRKGVWRDREDWSYRSAGRKALRTYHCPCYPAIVIRLWIQSAEKESLFQGWKKTVLNMSAKEIIATRLGSVYPSSGGCRCDMWGY